MDLLTAGTIVVAMLLGGIVDIREGWGGEDGAGVVLAERLLPSAQFSGEASIIQHEPSLVDDQQGRGSV